jgi:hypothetical protein
MKSVGLINFAEAGSSVDKLGSGALLLIALMKGARRLRDEASFNSNWLPKLL